MLTSRPRRQMRRKALAEHAQADCVLLLRHEVAERGGEVDVVPLYDTVAEPLAEEQQTALLRATYVTFTSSSTVRFFLEAGGRIPADARVISIGPVTSAAAREHGLAVHAEAERHDIDGLVDAILEDARR